MTETQPERADRTCSTCACYWIQTDPNNPAHKQGFCRRDPPTAQAVAVEVPRLRDGKTIPGRDGKPLTDRVQQLAFLYKPMLPILVCFDGWRELGTMPGDRFEQETLISMRRLWDDIQSEREQGALNDVPLDPDTPTG